jgi:hypothetical protein
MQIKGSNYTIFCTHQPTWQKLGWPATPSLPKATPNFFFFILFFSKMFFLIFLVFKLFFYLILFLMGHRTRVGFLRVLMWTSINLRTKV